MFILTRPLLCSTLPPLFSSNVEQRSMVARRVLLSVLYRLFMSVNILSAYFVVLPLRDEGVISLGLDKLPELFVGSLLLTLVAAPVSTLIFSSPNISKSKALLLIHRFFGVSLVLFFVLWHFSSPGYSFTTSKNLSKSMPAAKEELKVEVDTLSPTNSVDWVNHGWFYVSVRVGLFLWIALLNLITISSTWARIIDVMDTESGSRLFGFIGAGATLGQLCGSLFATGMTWMGPYLLLLAALLMELAAQSSMMIHKDSPCIIEELHPIRKADSDQRSEADSNQRSEADGQSSPSPRLSPKMSKPAVAPQIAAILDGFQLILSSSYLLYVSLFLWLGAVVSSFFYFQKVTVIASTVASPAGRRKLFAQINSFIAIFILAGQLTLTGRILTIAGVTVAICSTPFVALLNLVAVALWPMWLAVAVSETLRKVVTYVVTRPGRELLFTVVSQEEKYKAKVCIDVVVQRLGDATAAGLYKLLSSNFNGKISTVSLCAVPVCLLWIITAFHLGRRQRELAKYHSVST